MNRLVRSDTPGESSLFDRAFVSAHDVADHMATTTYLTGLDFCESWHLDSHGRFQCGTRNSALDSLDQWADDPDRLIEAVVDASKYGGCTTRWVVIDERAGGRRPTPDESDVEQFVRLRVHMAEVGVDVLDCVTFDGEDRWWSMCELLSGSTEWPPHVSVPLCAD